MLTNRAWAAFAAVAFIVSALVAQPQAPAKRVSADGVPFPEAGDRKFKEPPVPLVWAKLGALPEEMGPKVWSVEKSLDLLQRRVPGAVEGEWFSTGMGADAVVFSLTDGRVSKIELAYRNSDGNHIKAIRRQLQPSLDPETARAIRARLKKSNVTVRFEGGGVLFEADPVEWHILHHNPKPEIVKAMRERRLLVGMTAAQAIAVFGPPYRTGTGPGGPRSHSWELKRDVARWNDGTYWSKATDKVRMIHAAVDGDGTITDVEDTAY